MGLEVRRLMLGPLQTNSYLVRDATSGDMVVIDPGPEPQPLLAAVDEWWQQGTRLSAVWLTHCHFDHIAGIPALRQRWSPSVLAPALEAEWLDDPAKNGSALWPDLIAPVAVGSATTLLQAGQDLVIGAWPARILATPGHTPGSLSFWFAEAGLLFAGDTLFAGSVGRSDLPGGDAGQLTRSIREQILTLPDQTNVLPGHGPETTVGREKAWNPFL